MKEDLMQRKRKYLLMPKKELAERCLLIEEEIERRNNIINELEKYIDEDDWTSVNGEIATRLIKLKLQKLKGSGE